MGELHYTGRLRFVTGSTVYDKNLQQEVYFDDPDETWWQDILFELNP